MLRLPAFLRDLSEDAVIVYLDNLPIYTKVLEAFRERTFKNKTSVAKRLLIGAKWRNIRIDQSRGEGRQRWHPKGWENLFSPNGPAPCPMCQRDNLTILNCGGKFSVKCECGVYSQNGITEIDAIRRWNMVKRPWAA